MNEERATDTRLSQPEGEIRHHQGGGPADQLARLIALERQARRCETRKELVFTMVNWTHRLIPYYQAVFCKVTPAGRIALEAVSGLASIEPNTPFALWVTDFAKALMKTQAEKTVQGADIKDLPAETAAAWSKWMPEHVVICPLTDRKGHRIGVLLLAKEQAFLKQELALLEILTDTYGHAMTAFRENRIEIPFLSPKRKQTLIAAITVLIITILCLPVSESVLAPAEIVPSEPVVVTSPVKGMIRNINVQPYQLVKKGQLLFHLDDTELMNQLDLAEKNLQVVQADYLRAEQKAFHDPMSKADLEVLRLKAEEKGLTVQYTRDELERQKVTAQQDGMVLFNDRNDWIGRPVAIGEKVMTLANPQQVEIEINLSVDDAISIDVGAQVKLFLRTDPLNPLSALISRTSFKPEELKNGGMFFPLKAEFSDTKNPPRLGLQGTAKVYGGSVPLFYYIFRKPLAVLRRNIGV